MDRTFLRGLLEKLDKAKARAVGYDILLDQATEKEKDRLFREAMESASTPVVAAFSDMAGGLTESQSEFLSSYLGGVRKGYANVLTDIADGTVRIMYPGREWQGEWIPALAPALAEAAGIEIPHTPMAIDYLPAPEGQPSLFKIFPAHTLAFLPDAWFAGKFVLVGADQPHVDRHRTPLFLTAPSEQPETAGVMIHAQALAQILEGRKLNVLDTVQSLVLAMIVSLLGLAMMVMDRPMLIRMSGFAVLLVTLWGGGFLLFKSGGPLVPLIMPSLAMVVCAGLSTAYLWRDEMRQKSFIKGAFSRYLAPVVVDQLVSDPGNLKLGGEKREVTYVFTDLASFTSLTEKIDPEALARILNGYLDGMCSIVLEHCGTMDKIVGDAVVFFFNAPIDQPDHKTRAMECIFALDDFSESYRKKVRETENLELGMTRIGAHCGMVTVGNFGGENFFNYTGHGDSVNTAARLESVNKHLGTRICISGVVVEGCPDIPFRPSGRLVLKGKAIGLDTYEPLTAEQSESEGVRAYREAYALMEQEDPKALEVFRNLCETYPDDSLAQLHFKRLSDGETGVEIVMTAK